MSSSSSPRAKLSEAQRQCLKLLAEVTWSTPTIGFSIEVGGWTFKSTTADKLEGLGLVEKELDWSRGASLVTRRYRVTDAGRAALALPLPKPPAGFRLRTRKY